DNGDGTASISGTPTTATSIALQLGATNGNFVGTTTTGSSTVSVSAFNGPVVIGETVIGLGIPSGATITKINGTTVTLSQGATPSNSGVTLTAFAVQNFTLNIVQPPQVSNLTTNFTFTAGVLNTPFVITTTPSSPAQPITLLINGKLPAGVAFKANT